MKKPLLFIFLIHLLSYTNAQQVINFETLRYDDRDSGFRGNLEFAINLIQNKNQLINIGNKLNLIYKKDIHTYLFINEFNFIQANGQNIDYNSYQHIRYKRYLKEWLSGESFAQAQFNQQLGLKFRGLLGAGPRIRLIYEDSIKVFLGPMWMYEYEQTTDENAKNVRNRLSVYLSFLYFKQHNFNIDMVVYYQPDLIDFSDYRVLSEIKAIWVLTRRLTFIFSLSDSYNAHSPPGIPNQIFNLKNSFVYRF